MPLIIKLYEQIFLNPINSVCKIASIDCIFSQSTFLQEKKTIYSDVIVAAAAYQKVNKNHEISK